MLKLFAVHHNKIQFFGYEVANIVWVLHQGYRMGTTGYGLNRETYAALLFLGGSALIWIFDPERRPQMLFYGGVLLALGGVCLTAAGFILTGVAVTIASLETARGGVHVLDVYVARAQKGTKEQANKWPRLALGWYQRPVEAFAGRFPRIGYFINERPFITGALIKAPLRLEFIAKKVLLGDWVGAAVGLSWMVLGDSALAFNDPQLQRAVTERTQAAGRAESVAT